MITHQERRVLRSQCSFPAQKLHAGVTGRWRPLRSPRRKRLRIGSCVVCCWALCCPRELFRPICGVSMVWLVRCSLPLLGRGPLPHNFPEIVLLDSATPRFHGRLQQRSASASRPLPPPATQACSLLGLAFANFSGPFSRRVPDVPAGTCD